MPKAALLDRVNAARSPGGRKEWSEPPFWSLDQARQGWFSGSTATQERIENDFEGYVQGAYKADGVVFSCIDRRQQVFSQARFQWREFRDGRPGDLFGSSELALLENPWPNGTTGELLARMEVDASAAGNFYATTCADDGSIGRASEGKEGRRVSRMRPDWVTLVIDAPSGDYYGIDARVVGLLYEPRVAGSTGARKAQLLLPDEFTHFSPKPDPVARFRGMSWLTPVIREVQGDRAASEHKLNFFRRGATPALVVKGIRAANKSQFDAVVDMMEARHAGVENAYRTLYLTEGADAEAIGADLKQLDFKTTQSHGETRLAIAAGVPAAILGISEGLSGSSLNAGNFGSARRLFVDSTMRDLWAKASASLQSLVKPPRPGTSLWYDSRDIPFLREDAKDDADIRALDAQALRTLIDGGWKPDAAIEFIRTGDIGRLTGQHSGLVPVQLQPPSTTPPGSGDGAPDESRALVNGAGR